MLRGRGGSTVRGGMTDEEYRWEPVADCWTIRPVGEGSAGADWIADWADPDPDPAPVTTIAWRCWHIAVDCLDGYSARRFGETGSTSRGRSWVRGWVAAESELQRSWTVFRSGDAAISDDGGLFEQLGPTWGPYAEQTDLDLALHALREVTHHGAEIALLRDLYAAR